MTEKEMRPKVVNWLHFLGYKDAHECYSLKNCDVVGYKFNKRSGRKIPELYSLIAIELKVRDIAGVLRQCTEHRRSANQVYAAMPKETIEKMSVENHYNFINFGIGLLSVGDDVTIKTKSLKYAVDLSPFKKAMWRWNKRKKPK